MDLKFGVELDDNINKILSELKVQQSNCEKWWKFKDAFIWRLGMQLTSFVLLYMRDYGVVYQVC